MYRKVETETERPAMFAPRSRAVKKLSPSVRSKSKCDSLYNSRCLDRPDVTDVPWMPLNDSFSDHWFLDWTADTRRALSPDAYGVAIKQMYLPVSGYSAVKFCNMLKMAFYACCNGFQQRYATCSNSLSYIHT